LIKVTEAALVDVINHYCAHEAGVRNLRKCLDKIFRKVVKKIEDKKMLEEAIDVTPIST
jgi:ATP-dependent Lon protease